MSKKTGRSVATALALVASSALILSGCAGSGATAASGDTRIELVMMIPPTAAFEPYGDDATKLSRFSAVETLVRLNEDLAIEPLIATEWKQLDDLTWVFTLRDDVLFHDGTKLTPESVKNSLEQAQAATTPPRALKGIVIDSEVTGEHEITITTDTPDPLLANRLASPQLAILAAVAYEGEGNVNPMGAGSGPFEIVELNGTTTATLDRFEDYWGDVALASGIDVSFVPDGAARAGSLRAGTADFAESIPVSQVGLLDAPMVNEVFMPRSTILTLNNEIGPFADPAVRAAARAAIDPQAIVDTVYEGRADASVGLLGPAIPWAEDLRGDVESGVTPAAVDGVEITLATYTDRAENPEIAVQLEKQLEDAGFIVTQDVREYGNLEAEMLDPGFDAVIYSRGTMLDTGDPLSFLAQDFACDGGYNVAQLCDANVDALIAAGSQIPAGKERQQATMDAEAAILQVDAVVPLVHERVVQGSSGTFVDYVFDPLERRVVTEYTKPAN